MLHKYVFKIYNLLTNIRENQEINSVNEKKSCLAGLDMTFFPLFCTFDRIFLEYKTFSLYGFFV